MEGKKEKSFERREALINVALIEFGDKGYDNASLNNILKESGISKGTFYYHFKNKEELYVYLIDLLVEEKLKFFNENINLEDMDIDIFSLLKTMIKIGLKFAKYRPEIDRFSQSYLKDLNNPVFYKIKEKYQLNNNDYLDSLINNAYDKGELRDDLPKNFIKNIINYLLFNLHDISNIIDIDEYIVQANYLVDFLRDGFGKKNI